MKNRIHSIRWRPRGKGTALVLVMVMVLVTAIVIGAVLSGVVQETRQTHRARVLTNSLAGSKATLAQMQNNVLHVARSRPPQQTGGIIENLSSVIREIAAVPPPGYRIHTAGDGTPLAFVLDAGPNDFQYREITDPADHWFGYSTARLDFEVLSLVSEDTNVARNMGFPGVGTKSRVVIDYIPLYQFAIFYDPDLELHPGPVMDIRGRVHSNTDIELSAVRDIHFHERVTSAGRFMRFTSENQSGDVQILDRSTPNPQFVSMRGDAHPEVTADWLTHLVPNWFQAALDAWDGNVRDMAHGVTPIEPPLPPGSGAEVLIRRATEDDVPALRATKFEYMADLIVSGDPGRPETIRMYIPEKNAGGEITGVQELDPAVRDEIVDVGEFYDGQQLSVVKTIDIDVRRLWQLTPVDFEDGEGVVYISTTPGIHDEYSLEPGNSDPEWMRDSDGNVLFDDWGYPRTITPGWRNPGRNNYMPAVRLHNAQRLPRNAGNGFAFYTDRPMYVTGDFNTQQPVTAVLGGDAITVTAYKQELATVDLNDSGVLTATDDGHHIAQGHTRDMGNRWDTNIGNHRQWWNQGAYNWEANNQTDGRHAAVRADNTTTNAILLMGNAPSVENPNNPLQYRHQSGGAHNVIRYLENWSGRRHTFEGSIIVLFPSQVAVLHNRAGPRYWHSFNTEQGYYNPPQRDYRWDDSLRRSEPPPGMPVIIEVFEYPVERVEPDYIASRIPEGGSE